MERYCFDIIHLSKGSGERIERKNSEILRIKACKEHTILGWKNQKTLGIKKIRIAENCRSQKEIFLRVRWVSRGPDRTRRARRKKTKEKDEETIIGDF